ncbi:Hypothetical protein HVR_LOCUS1091 [uncultured virus]|nr:Hypothetical protein HVR_LOCUS1091 [uncultured virus]
MTTSKKVELIVIPPPGEIINLKHAIQRRWIPAEIQDLKIKTSSPRRRTIGSPRDLVNIPPGSLILTPDTPPGPDEPNEILTARISKKIDEELSKCTPCPVNSSELTISSESVSSVSVSSDTTLESNSRIFDMSDRCSKLSDRTSESSDGTLELTDRTAELSDRTSESSDNTVELSDRTAESSDRTVESSDKSSQSGDRTTESSDKSSQSGDRTVESSDKSSQSGDRTTEPNDKSSQSDNRISEISDKISKCSPISRILKVIDSPKISKFSRFLKESKSFIM